MTQSPKEYAIELVDKYVDAYFSKHDFNLPLTSIPVKELARQCALIDTQGKIDLLESIQDRDKVGFQFDNTVLDGWELTEYYQEVLKEIQNIK
jgi:hypothetical protein